MAGCSGATDAAHYGGVVAGHGKEYRYVGMCVFKPFQAQLYHSNVYLPQRPACILPA